MSLPTLPEYVLLHVPHDSTLIPAEVRSQFLLTDAEIAYELARMTDHATFDLFAKDLPPDQVVRAEVSRLVTDVERFPNDAEEPMAAVGMGAVYTHTSDGRALRGELTSAQRDHILARWYYPHHRRLSAAVQRCLERFGRVLIIDAHSFGPPLPCDRNQAPDRPRICIGADEYHTPAWLADALVNAFRDRGFADIRINTPFSGTMVSAEHHRRDGRVLSVMIEISRALYWDDERGLKNVEFVEVATRIRVCIARVAASFPKRGARHE